MQKRFFRLRIGALLSVGMATAIGFQPSAQATERAQNTGRILAVGMLAHDHGPFSDDNEDGVDLNLEAQFAPLDVWGAPRPHLGVAANFGGETSVAYAGLGFRLLEQPAWFADGLLGAAVHNGPLHKDPLRCDLYSDCGFGTRVLPRFGVEFGYRLQPSATLSLLFDHMSHKWIFSGENEGLDHVGLRYMWNY